MAALNDEELKKLVLDVLTDAKLEIVQQMRKNGQYVTGNTAQRILCDCKITQFGLTAHISAPISLLTLETGRRAGRTPYAFRNIIFNWSIDKRLQFKNVSARKRFAYYTARKIAQEGSWIYRQGFRVDVYTTILRKTTETLKRKLQSKALIPASNIKLLLPTTTLKQTL